MADGVRGKQYENFPIDIQKGIVLHRAIDTFTDAHPLFRQSTKKLHSRYHHYAGVIVDMYYDHFLAKNWSNYHSESLTKYAANFYQSLTDNFPLLTLKTQNLLPYMVEYNWLVNYQSIDGLERILASMVFGPCPHGNLQSGRGKGKITATLLGSSELRYLLCC